MSAKRLEAVRRIAVVRANGIGDYCFAVPALAALRAAYPDAEIVLLGKRWHAEFLTGRPGPVDRVVVVPPYVGVSAEPGDPVDSDAQERFFAAMQAERFDIALQLHGGGRYSNPFTRRLGARYTAGLRTPDAAPLDAAIPHVYFQHEVARYLEVVALVGARPLTLEPEIAVTEADRAELAPLGLDPNAPLVVLHPGATDPRRHWPPEKFAAVGRALASRGARIAVIGTGPERELARRLRERLVVPALDVCDRLSLGGLAALLAASRLVVSNDSGPLHLAAAVGAATVGIFWCGNLINGGPLTRSRHRPFISWRLDCPVCGRNTLHDNCTHRASFVADIPEEDVVEAALALYDAEADRAAARSASALA
ncbi:MAG TPA: glycosyltransferase family 9 protein [Burkholderiales bacterium]